MNSRVLRLGPLALALCAFGLYTSESRAQPSNNRSPSAESTAANFRPSAPAASPSAVDTEAATAAPQPPDAAAENTATTSATVTSATVDAQAAKVEATTETSVDAQDPDVVRALETAPKHIDTALVDSTLQGAAQDLGLVVQQLLPAQVLNDGNYLAWEKQLQLPSSGKVTLGALLIPDEQAWRLRLVALSDKGFAHSTTTVLDTDNVEVATVRALTQLANQFVRPRPQPSKKSAGTIVSGTDTSEGKATLAATGALFGGYLGFAIENVGGSADAALIYPLVALGSGVGMATALVAAEEWPVSRPRAWYIAGGGFWLTSAAVLIANEQDLAHPTDRYPYGLIGTAVGIGAASAVSSFKEITEPQALLSNEGGAFGTLAGGLIQRLAAPSSTELPALGMGIGGAAGWLTAGLIGPFALTELSSSRVLFAGLGGAVGALTGAAVASPAVVNSDRREPKKEGVLFASALGGLVLGSVVGYWFGDSEPETPAVDAASVARRTKAAPTAGHTPRVTPGIGTIPEPLEVSPYALRLPSVTNLTLSGTW